MTRRRSSTDSGDTSYGVKVPDVTDKVYDKNVPRDPDGNVQMDGEITMQDAKEIGALTPEAALQNTVNARIADQKLKGKADVRWGETEALFLFDEVKRCFGPDRTSIYISREEPQPPVTWPPLKMSSLSDRNALYEYVLTRCHRKSGETLYKILYKDANGSTRAKGDLRMPSTLDEPMPQMPQQQPFFGQGSPYVPPPYGYGSPPMQPPSPYGYPPQVAPAPPAPAALPPAPAPAPPAPAPQPSMQPMQFVPAPAPAPQTPSADPMVHGALGGIYQRMDALVSSQQFMMERFFQILEKQQQPQAPPAPTAYFPTQMGMGAPPAAAPAPQAPPAHAPPASPPPATTPLPPPAAAQPPPPPQQQFIMVQTAEGPRPAVMISTPQGPQLLFLQATPPGVGMGAPPAAAQPAQPAQAQAPIVSPFEQMQQATTQATQLITGLGSAYKQIQQLVQPKVEEEEEPPPPVVQGPAPGESAPFQTMPLGFGQNPMILAYNQKDGSINWVGTMIANADKAISFFKGISETVSAMQQAQMENQGIVRQVQHQPQPQQALPPASTPPTPQPSPPAPPPPTNASSLIPSLDSWQQVHG